MMTQLTCGGWPIGHAPMWSYCTFRRNRPVALPPTFCKVQHYLTIAFSRTEAPPPTFTSSARCNDMFYDMFVCQSGLRLVQGTKNETLALQDSQQHHFMRLPA